MYRTLMTCALFCTAILPTSANAEPIEKQRFVVSLGAPLKPGDDALRLVMEICELVTFKQGNRFLIVVETRDQDQLEEYLWTRSRTPLRIGKLPKGSDLPAIADLLRKDTANRT